MTKLDFILALQKELTDLPQEDIQQRLTFYSEMIEDRVEEGLSEEEAIVQIGSVEEVAAQILADYPVNASVTVEGNPPAEEEKPKRRLRKWELALLILGSPLWIVLLIAALALVFSAGISVLAIVFSVIVSLWSAVISLWAVFVFLVTCALALPVAAISFACIGNTHSCIATIGVGLVCGGLAILFFYACKLFTKGMLALTMKTAMFLKRCFIRRGKL